MAESPQHFKGKEAIGHVAEVQARGIITSHESHASEAPGHIAAGADALRETALLVVILAPLLQDLRLLLPIMVAWAIWKFGRSAWLGWSRLERLHRVMAEEKWEIEHHRKQERDELRVLYRAKGFDGKLLEDVLDVLMADGDRLLRVMVEEELGLSLESQEHPLKQGLGAAVGVVVAATACIVGAWLGGTGGAIGTAAVVTLIGGVFSATYEGNQRIPAAVWNVGLLLLSCTVAYQLAKLL